MFLYGKKWEDDRNEEFSIKIMRDLIRKNNRISTILS